jgi:hypothetical protein
LACARPSVGKNNKLAFVSNTAHTTRPHRVDHPFDPGLPAWEADMQRFVHNENIALYRKLIAESEGSQSRDEDRHQMLLTLLAEEEARDIKPPNGRPFADA